jgi:hypothetical protein
MARVAQSTERWRDWVMLVLGAWLFLSPWILGFAGGAPVGAEGAVTGPTAAAWNAWIVGVVVAALAIWAIAMFAQWQDWLNGILGVWLVIAPWVLGFGSLAAAAWNSVIVGLLVLAFAAWELWEVRQKATA